MKKQNAVKLAIVIFFGINAVLLFAVVSGFRPGRKQNSASYEFTSVRRGNLERTVSSSGKINPVSTIRVLPQMSGKVERIYVDYNDEIRRGDILAELNTDMLRLRREQQYATLIKVRANYELQEINYRNQLILAEKNLISEYELRTSKTMLDGHAADLAVAEANLKVIETEINQYAYIISPIDGIVLDRQITVGDSVVDSSSNNAYSMFTLAENLREMQIEASVGELDVALIQKGQAVRFTLESMPGRSFSGEVESLRMVPVVVNNVVSYTVIIRLENHDGSLLPGMTCAVDFIVDSSEDVLLVPNAALRYQPTSLSAERIDEMVFIAGLEGLSEEQRQTAITARALNSSQSTNQSANTGIAAIMTGQGQGMRMMGGGGRQASGSSQARGNPSPVVIRHLWYMNGDGKLEVMHVQTGISNGTFTEIISPQDMEGRQLILRERI